MKKTLIRALAAMVTVMLLLTGCSLITVDEEMQAAEDAAAREKDYATVLVDFADGDTITKGDVISAYNDNYSYYSYMYSIYYGQIPDELSDTVKSQVVDSAIAQNVIKRHAGDYNVELTDELRKSATETAESEWEEAIANYLEQNPSSGDDEAAREAAVKALGELGYDHDAMVEDHINSEFVNAIYEQMVADVTEVPEDRLQQAYDEKVAADEASYSGDTASYETAVQNGTTVYWNPEGYRTVQHILLKPADEELLTQYKEISDEMSALQSELMDLVGQTSTADDEATAEVAETAEDVRDMSAVKDDINAKNEELKAVEEKILAACQDTIDEIQGKLDEGEAFPDLINDYTADSDALLYVSANTTSLITPFKNAAMTLEKVGDVSEPVVGQYGVHLIYYAGDVKPGAVALDDVRDALTEETLETLKEERYDALVDQWIEEAGVTKHLDRWED